MSSNIQELRISSAHVVVPLSRRDIICHCCVALNAGHSRRRSAGPCGEQQRSGRGGGRAGVPGVGARYKTARGMERNGGRRRAMRVSRPRPVRSRERRRSPRRVGDDALRAGARGGHAVCLRERACVGTLCDCRGRTGGLGRRKGSKQVREAARGDASRRASDAANT